MKPLPLLQKQMKTASAWLIVGEKGSNVFKENLTPPEVQLLVYMHHPVAGKCPIHDLKEGKDVTRSDANELQRLRQKYQPKKVEELFGKVNPRFPKDFKEALIVPGLEGEATSVIAAQADEK